MGRAKSLPELHPGYNLFTPRTPAILPSQALNPPLFTLFLQLLCVFPPEKADIACPAFALYLSHFYNENVPLRPQIVPPKSQNVPRKSPRQFRSMEKKTKHSKVRGRYKKNTIKSLSAKHHQKTAKKSLFHRHIERQKSKKIGRFQRAKTPNFTPKPTETKTEN